MSVVNFTIPNPLLKQIEALMKQLGFSSKAEFFRQAAREYLERVRANRDQGNIPNDDLIESMRIAEEEYAAGKTKGYDNADDLIKALNA